MELDLLNKMKNIVLAAGYATRMYPLTENFPKPLLSIGNDTILDRMLADIDGISSINEHIIVTNHRFFQVFEEWLKTASKRYSKPIKLFDDGSTSNDNRIGAVGDLIAAIKKFEINEDILVAAADNLLDFSLQSLVDFFVLKHSSVIYYLEEKDETRLRKCGVATIDSNGRVVELQEKPSQPKSNKVTPPFYVFRSEDIPLIISSIDNGCKWDAPGNLAAYIAQVSSLYAIEMPGTRRDIGSLEGYYAAKEQAF